MGKTEIVNSLSRNFHKAGFKLKKHSPEILVVTGVVGTVVAAVMACKATTKLSGVLEQHKDKVDMVHEATETKEDTNKKLAIVYAQTGLEFVKLYGPSVLLGALSITGILTSNNILRKRNIALAAAYATIDKGFKEYRSRVVDRFGKELDRELKYNIKSQEIEEVVVDEKGKEKTVKKTIEVADPNEHSIYARFFDEYCEGWSKDAEYNLIFLKQQQNYANDRLKAKGYLFLNEVYTMLGIEPTKAGQIVGWVYDEEHPVGDNFVDFGMYEVSNPKARDFVNGRERSILLDFNVDGNILDMM